MPDCCGPTVSVPHPFSRHFAFSFFAALKPVVKFTAKEANITQTVASAAGTMASCAGLVGPIPALHLLGQDYSPWALLLWGLFVGFLGIFFAVPLRTRLLVKENLRFPSGCATFETISAMMQSSGAEAKARVKWLFGAAAVAAAFTFVAYFLPILQHPPLIEAMGKAGAAASAFGWKLFLDPMLTGAGALSGAKAGSSMMLGAVLAWGIIGPIVHSLGLTRGNVMGLDTGVRGWLLWPGVTLMLVDSIVTLCLSVPWASLVPCAKNETKFSHLEPAAGAESRNGPVCSSPIADTEAVASSNGSSDEPSLADIDTALEQVRFAMPAPNLQLMPALRFLRLGV